MYGAIKISCLGEIVLSSAQSVQSVQSSGSTYQKAYAVTEKTRAPDVTSQGHFGRF